jgi:hypothetical protein
MGGIVWKDRRREEGFANAEKGARARDPACDARQFDTILGNGLDGANEGAGRPKRRHSSV